MKDQQLPRRSHKKHTLMNVKAEDAAAFGLAGSPYRLTWFLGFGVIVHAMFRSVVTGQAKCLAL